MYLVGFALLELKPVNLLYHLRVVHVFSLYHTTCDRRPDQRVKVGSIEAAFLFLFRFQCVLFLFFSFHFFSTDILLLSCFALST